MLNDLKHNLGTLAAENTALRTQIEDRKAALEGFDKDLETTIAQTKLEERTFKKMQAQQGSEYVVQVYSHSGHLESGKQSDFCSFPAHGRI